MKLYLCLIPLGLALLNVSCKGNKAATKNPYQNNPYYNSSSGSTTNYSSTPASSSYPSYTENTYTPPSSVPSVPPVPTYNQPSYSGPAGGSTGSSSPKPVSYSGSGSKTYTVESGDTLWSISRKQGASVAAIKSANGLTGDTIRVGQKLVIP
jgi:LysM repeat protein